MASGTQTAKDAVGGAIDRARDTVSQVAEQAREGAATVTEKAKEAGSTVVNKADEVAGRVGSGLETAADTIRDNAPNSGVLGSAASKVADTLEKSGKYLEEEGLSGLAGDLTELIKRNPIPALLVAVAVGVLIARATRS
jgi:methyl-accepting chemotaxis protein